MNKENISKIDNDKQLQIWIRGNSSSRLFSEIVPGQESELHLQDKLPELQYDKTTANTTIPVPEALEESEYNKPCQTDFKRYIKLKTLEFEEECPEYHLDEEDQKWLDSNLYVAAQQFEKIIEEFERACSQQALLLEDAKRLLCHEPVHIVIAIHEYWLTKRANLGKPLLTFIKRSGNMTTRKYPRVDESFYKKMPELLIRMRLLRVPVEELDETVFGCFGCQVMDTYRINIIINSMDGRNIKISIRQDETILALKHQIQESIRFDNNEHRLHYKENLLIDDRKTIGDCGISDGSVINVVEVIKFKMTVLAMFTNYYKVEFMVFNTNRIIDVKKKIEEKIGLSSDEQILVYNETILEDFTTIDEYQMTENSVINVVDKRRERLIFAKRMNGEKFTLVMNKNYGIIDVKKKVEEKIGLSSDVQILMYNRKPLFYIDTTDECQMTENSVLNVLDKRIERLVYVTGFWSGKFTIAVNKNDKIIDLKKNVEEFRMLQDFRLCLRSRTLDDNNTVDESDIGECDSIDIRGRLRGGKATFFAKRSFGQKFELKVPHNTKIKDLKNFINLKTKLLPYQQMLMYGGDVLDNLTTLGDCGVPIGGTIKIIPIQNIPIKRMKIFAITAHGQRITISTEKTSKIIDLKNFLKTKTNISPSEQILMFNGEDLDNDMTVGHYQIRKFNTIHIIRIGRPPINNDTRGICLVISNKQFTGNGLETRCGTEIDEKRIQSVFKPMGYQVDIHRDVCNIKSVIEDTKILANSSHKILIVFILSHGGEKGVYRSDGALISLKNISNRFANTQFPSFAGKPKILFFVCCRGSKKDPGVDVAGGSMAVYDSATTTVTRVPAMAGLFIGYATCPSYVSCRNETEGTYYVSTLCNVIEKHPRWSVNDIHQEVQSILSRRIINAGIHYQMPYFENMLMDHAYFVD